MKTLTSIKSAKEVVEKALKFEILTGDVVIQDGSDSFTAFYKGASYVEGYSCGINIKDDCGSLKININGFMEADVDFEEILMHELRKLHKFFRLPCPEQELSLIKTKVDEEEIY